MGILAKAFAVSAAAAGAAYLGGPSLLDHIRRHQLLRSLNLGRPWDRGPTGDPPPPWTCATDHKYTTQIISVDPLLIYIADFVHPSEAAAIIDMGTPLLAPSPLTGGPGASDTTGHQSRTSWSAPLPLLDTPTAVGCVLARASALLGTLLAPGRDDVGAPQMVRYEAGQRFDAHRDWFARPRLAPADAEAGRRRLYNRVATLFVVLQANHSAGGETWFPHVGPFAAGKEEAAEEGEGKRVWREHEDGGLAFRAVPGNALFWVNLFPNGTGDERVLHAGLPIKDGVKTAMNIWPRAYFGPDA
ncbi:hypothetical protein QBC33DRAFT_583904 [Phialemonium atrogriseum]|uniref:Prolyl 4-hydroxylase alpha subunit domain-containing protein n=1 Tax=Phialemonium atrogriseum TaxID=1093897 RepID=A0AAJ0C9P9_9PEZI|nr:uncharacterized protein QBC33DRAFT_583904 [Phialemonium atrogriseum]KAK1772745.1 hypothetical protein QBC33DRAFT_583904 [Phialemonium atrogriseum]